MYSFEVEHIELALPLMRKSSVVNFYQAEKTIFKKAIVIAVQNCF
jgi:hypothetical protein